LVVAKTLRRILLNFARPHHPLRQAMDAAPTRRLALVATLQPAKNPASVDSGSASEKAGNLNPQGWSWPRTIPRPA
jgi:hypothetical protein